VNIRVSSGSARIHYQDRQRACRHLLIQAAWKYTRKPMWSKRLREHWNTQPAALEAIAQKAKDRLYKRYHYLVNRGKAKQKAIVAIARELAGFLWSAGQIEATAA